MYVCMSYELVNKANTIYAYNLSSKNKNRQAKRQLTRRPSMAWKRVQHILFIHTIV